MCSSGVNWLQWLVFTCKELSILNPLIVTQFLVSAYEGLTSMLHPVIMRNTAMMTNLIQFIFVFNCLHLVVIVCCTMMMCLTVPDVSFFLQTKNPDCYISSFHPIESHTKLLLPLVLLHFGYTARKLWNRNSKTNQDVQYSDTPSNSSLCSDGSFVFAFCANADCHSVGTFFMSTKKSW